MGSNQIRQYVSKMIFANIKNRADDREREAYDWKRKKPWNVSDEKTERTNPQNGLCLNVLHDKAFDKGLIIINNKYEIIISKQMKNTEMDQSTKDWFMKCDHKEIIKSDKFSRILNL